MLRQIEAGEAAPAGAEQNRRNRELQFIDRLRLGIQPDGRQTATDSHLSAAATFASAGGRA
jgi:hypothetical protein